MSPRPPVSTRAVRPRFSSSFCTSSGSNGEMPKAMCPMPARRIADLALVLAAFVCPGLPAEQRRVERHRLLVVGHFERDVIEPDRFPAGGLEGGRRGHLAAGGIAPPVLPAAVADLQIEAVGILDVEALEILALVVGDGIEPALAQLGLHLLRVPR